MLTSGHRLPREGERRVACLPVRLELALVGVRGRVRVRCRGRVRGKGRGRGRGRIRGGGRG